MRSLWDVFLVLFAVIIIIRTDIIEEHQKLAESGPVFRLDFHFITMMKKKKLLKKIDIDQASPIDIFWLYLVPPVSLC